MKGLGLGSWPRGVVVLILCIVPCANFVCTEGFDSLLQLPKPGSARTRFRSRRVLHIGDFGAKGDGLANDTQAFIDAWEIACSFAGRSRIVIPAGYSFLVHPVILGGPCKSRVTIVISGTVLAPRDPASWKGLNPRKWLYFHGVNHLTVEGGGIINGKGWLWWARSCKINRKNPCRHAPTAITFHKCKDLRVTNLRVVNGQQMQIAFTNCIRVLAYHLMVISPAFSPNTDGIHISSSRGVDVKDSIVKTGDDCISIVGNSSRIKIMNLACGPGHGISIGSLGKSNSTALVRDVIVDGALLSNTDNGVRIKTWQGGGGNAMNIRFQHIMMENVSKPIIIDQYYCDSKLPCANQTSAVKVDTISFMHIKGTSATEEAIIFSCSDDAPCEGLYLEDIELVSHRGGIATSFCWQAYGSVQGRVNPPPCLSSCERFIKQRVSSPSPKSVPQFSTI